jgi:hypothetical protein
LQILDPARSLEMTIDCVLLVSASLFGQTATNPGVPTVHDLMKKVPVLRSADEKCRSLEVIIRMKEPGEMDLKIRMIYRAPGQSAMLVCDGSDGTPLIYVVDRKMLLYDPVGPAVYRSNALRSFLLMQTERGRESLIFGMTNDPKRGSIDFDIKSLLSEPATSEEVVSTGGTTYRVTRSFGEGQQVVHFDVSLPGPVTRVEEIAKEAKEPNSIWEFILNGELKDAEFTFPDEKRLAETIMVKELPANSLLATAGGIVAALRACDVRMGAHDPKNRDRATIPGLPPIHWDQVEQNDAKYAQAMRDLIPTAAKEGFTPRLPQVRYEDLFKPRFLGTTPVLSPP